MRVGMLTTSYPSDGDPVAGSFVREMARAFVARGHRVEIWCAPRKGSPAHDRCVEVSAIRCHAGGLFDDGGAPDALASGRWRPRFGAVAYSLGAVRAVGALASCDALVSHFVVPNAFIVASAARDRPHLAIAHGTDAHYFGRLPAVAQRWLVRHATAVQVTSKHACASWDPRARDAPNVFVRPMGVARHAPRRSREAVRRALGVGNGFLVVAVARLVRVKGLDVLIDAAARADLDVVIAGDGPERDALAMRSNAIGARVRFVGAIPPDERDDLLAACDAFAAPPRTLADGRCEGAPVAVLEAMAAGLPVVATHVGGLAETAGDAALLVPPDDAEALAHALASLRVDGALHASHAQASRARASQFGWDDQIARIEKLFTAGRLASPAAATIETPRSAGAD